MGKYADNLEQIIQIYDTSLPEKFEKDNDPKQETLDKETNRFKYLFGILEGSLAVLENVQDLKLQHNLLTEIKDVLRHHSEGGGAGSEVFTRLIALGVIEGMPQIEITDRTEWVSPTESKVEIDQENNTIKLVVFFNANVPDETGEETWMYSLIEGNVCISRITLKLGDKDRIMNFLKESHKSYDELMRIKYPENGL